MLKTKLYNLLKTSAILTVLSGCASTYNGLGPNTYVREPSEIAEQKALFRLESHAFSNGYHLGGKRYSTSSIVPIVEDLSPSAASKMVWGSTYATAGLVLGIAGLGTFLNAEPSKRCMTCLPTILTVGGIGLFTFGNWKIRTGVREYNGKLEQAFQVQTEL